MGSFVEAWKIATENGHLDLQTLISDEDTEDVYQCSKLRTKALCNDDPMCAWWTNPNSNKRFCGYMEDFLAAEEEKRLAREAKRAARQEEMRIKREERRAYREAEKALRKE